MAPLIQDSIRNVAVSPYDELISYEFLYAQEGSSLRKMVDATVHAGKLPHEAMYDRFGAFLPEGYEDVEAWVAGKLGGFGVAINQTPSWPRRLSDSNRPTPILYYRGDIALLEARSISVVGARKATDEGRARASRIARELAEAGIAVTTGLALGIDTAATKSAMEHGGEVIGVIGTPIDECYPKDNKELQEAVAEDHLLVSQVPFYKYSKQPFSTKKYYFPERNELMAAISDATVIVEASDTSGTLTQARACLHQGRPLFILRSCIERTSTTWPSKYLGKDNVYILDSTDQLLKEVYG